MHRPLFNTATSCLSKDDRLRYLLLEALADASELEEVLDGLIASGALPSPEEAFEVVLGGFTPLTDPGELCVDELGMISPRRTASKDSSIFPMGPREEPTMIPMRSGA